MPVGWGGSPAPDMSYDIRQYVKFFDSIECDFDISRKAGQWLVSVWGKRPITPIKVQNIAGKNDNGFVVYEDGYITSLREHIASSGMCGTLDEALLSAYRAVRARPTS